MRLILLPGLDGSGELFRWLERELPAHISREVVAYPIEGSQAYSRLARLALDRLGCEPAVVLGESFSGPVAIEMAARAPQNVTALILAGTFLTPPWPSAVLRLAALVDHRWAPDWAVHSMMLGRSRHTEVKTLLNRLTATLPPSVIAARLKEVAGADARPALAQVHCPILVLHGSRDWLVSPSRLEKALVDRPHTVVKRLPAPHMSLQLAPEAAAHAIEEFMRKLDKEAQ